MKAILSSVFALGLLLDLAKAEAAGEADWPCVQRKVPQVTAGMVWAGPEVEGLDEDWRADPEVKLLARRISARNLAMEEAQKLIESYAANLKDQKNRKLTILFAATLATVNRDRGSIIAGIGRYTQRQKNLAERIQEQTSELNLLPQNGSAEEQERRRELEERQTWDMRIFEERERSLAYVCEQPVILEQRLFALSREIMKYLD